MRVTLLVVGKSRNAALTAAIGEYEQRVSRYWAFNVIEVREAPGGRSMSVGEVREKEAANMLSRLPVNSRLIACESTGESVTSEVFAGWLQKYRDGAQDVTFLIGGAHGLGSSISERADQHMSMSSWTLPHELARLVLVEQLYRAGTILRGEPYHK